MRLGGKFPARKLPDAVNVAVTLVSARLIRYGCCVRAAIVARTRQPYRCRPNRHGQ